MSGQHPGRIKFKGTEFAESTCLRKSIYTATQRTRAMVPAGRLTLAPRVITEVHLWDGEEQLRTHGTTWKWTSEDSKMLLRSPRQWAGATMCSILITDGSQRNNTLITSNGKGLQKKKSHTIEKVLSTLSSHI